MIKTCYIRLQSAAGNQLLKYNQYQSKDGSGKSFGMLTGLLSYILPKKDQNEPATFIQIPFKYTKQDAADVYNEIMALGLPSVKVTVSFEDLGGYKDREGKGVFQVTAGMMKVSSEQKSGNGGGGYINNNQPRQNNNNFNQQNYQQNYQNNNQQRQPQQNNFNQANTATAPSFEDFDDDIPF